MMELWLYNLLEIGSKTFFLDDLIAKVNPMLKGQWEGSTCYEASEDTVTFAIITYTY